MNDDGSVAAGKRLLWAGTAWNNARVLSQFGKLCAQLVLSIIIAIVRMELSSPALAKSLIDTLI